MKNEFEKIYERSDDVGVLARRVYGKIERWEKDATATSTRNEAIVGFLYKDPDFTIPVKEDELYTLFEKGGEVKAAVEHENAIMKIALYDAISRVGKLGQEFMSPTPCILTGGYDRSYYYYYYSPEFKNVLLSEGWEKQNDMWLE